MFQKENLLRKNLEKEKEKKKKEEENGKKKEKDEICMFQVFASIITSKWIKSEKMKWR
jgi:hypothetical protein